MSHAAAAGGAPPAAAAAGTATPGSVAATAAVREGWRPVVTAFVQRRDGRVLVVKRSDKVSTYQGMWGGVSGGVEPADTSLLDRAHEEVEEEVAIPRRLLRLAACGRPLPVRDGTRHFLVHPFLFRTRKQEGSCGAGSEGGGGGGSGSGAGAEVTSAVEEAVLEAAREGEMGEAARGDPPVALNWENSEARWVLPSELAALPHVPLLPETLRRLVLPRYMAAHVEYLASDRAHGAAELADYTVQAFGAVAAYELDGSAEQRAQLDAQQPCWQAVCEAYRNMAWHIACARPSMAAIANAAAGVMAALDSELRARADPFAPSPTAVRVALLEAVRAEAARLKAQRAQLKERAAALIPPGARVMTTSYSSTVLVALAAAAADGRLGAVVCCESRPLCEGVALARALAAAGARDVTVITDAQAAAFLGSVDLVLLGADALSEAGAVNKVGSRLIALAAREEGIPVYACCDSGKISIGGPVEQLVGLGLGSGGGGGGGSIASSGGGVVGSTGVAGGRNQGGAEEHEEKGEDEVTQGWPAQLRAAAAVGGGVTGGGKGAGAGGGIEVRNVYFEAVPLPLLTGGVVTDQGVVAEDDIRAAVASRRRQYLRAFDLATLEHPPRPDVKSGGLGVA